MPAIKFFKAPADFRLWLQTHHAKLDVLWLGFYKKASGRPRDGSVRREFVRVPDAIIHASMLREALCGRIST